MIKKEKFSYLKYIVKYPENYTEGQKYPILLFLHGAGTRGDDLSMVLENPFFDGISKHKDFPFIAVAPQCNGENWFDVFETLIKLAKYIYEQPFTDKKRFYVMGASMGGYGTWQIAISCPEIFAAIVPICGGGMYWEAYRLENTPIWAFHGDSDSVVCTEESIKMTERVNDCGGNAKLTIYENCTHDAWTQTYENEEVFKWLLSHEKEETTEFKNAFNDAQIYG